MPDPDRVDATSACPGCVCALGAGRGRRSRCSAGGWPGIVAVLPRGRGPEPRWDHVAAPARASSLANVLGPAPDVRRAARSAWPTSLIFWAFVFYADELRLEPRAGPAARSCPSRTPTRSSGWRSPMELFGVAGPGRRSPWRRSGATSSAAAAGAQSRRRLRSSLLTLITLLALGGAAWRRPGRPLGRARAGLSARRPPRRCTSAMWWVHMVTVLGFLAYLPYSKHLHLLASPFGVFFASLEPGARCRRRPRAPRAWRSSPGGSCSTAWPAPSAAAATAPARRSPAGYALSPQDAHPRREASWSLRRQRPATATGPWSTRSGAEAVWACTTCLACMERCPVFNEHIPLIVEMRRHLVVAGRGGARGCRTCSWSTDALRQLVRPVAARRGRSGRRDLDFKIKDARKEPVEYLWFVGDYASFDPRVQEVTRAAARVFQRAGAGLRHPLRGGAERRQRRAPRRRGGPVRDAAGEEPEGARRRRSSEHDRHHRSAHLPHAEERVRRGDGHGRVVCTTPSCSTS